MADLRLIASQSQDALCAGDFARLGAAMVANTEAQRRLHPALVGSDAARLIEQDRPYRNIPIDLSRTGLRVWNQEFTPPS